MNASRAVRKMRSVGERHGDWLAIAVVFWLIFALPPMTGAGYGLMGLGVAVPIVAIVLASLYDDLRGGVGNGSSVQ